MDFNGCKDFLMETAKTLLAADSPSGFTQNAVAAAERDMDRLPWGASVTVVLAGDEAR